MFNLREAKAKNNLKALIVVGSGKDSTVPMFFCRFIEDYVAPDNSRPLLPVLSDSLFADTITGDKPKVYFSYAELENDIDRLKAIKARIIGITDTIEAAGRS